MESVIFSGLQGSGKSSFYKSRFFSTHLRISLDLLRTRNREERLLEYCLQTRQRFLVDNTNPTRVERAKYIGPSRESGFRVIGYYFSSKIDDCLKRNSQRPEKVPDVAILSTAKKLELPAFAEGFDELWYVRIEDSGFVVEKWNDEI